ncbi:MAG: hypothetical protein IPG42_20305 [Betaproteobacteria bacterium]|nr:hypothetical protein [Betaproteobacteria bacterium]
MKDLPPGSVVHETLDELVELVLLNRVQGLATDTDVVEGKIAILQKEIAKRSGAVQRKLLNILGHVRQIDVYEKEMPTLVSQIKSRNEFGGLQRAYGQLFDAPAVTCDGFSHVLAGGFAGIDHPGGEGVASVACPVPATQVVSQRVCQCV